MAATKDEILRWLEDGKAQNATHVIIVCNTSDWKDYPVFVFPDENVQSKSEKYGKNNSHGLPILVNSNMQKVMEVYSLLQDLGPQLDEHRAFHFN